MAPCHYNSSRGFTLIEVLLALTIIAIALTALLKASSQTIQNTTRIKETSVSHWVQMQAVIAVQLGLLPIHLNEEVTQVTTMLGERWYWRARLTQSVLPATQQITITVSQEPAGPFNNPLIAYRYAP